jgi:RNA polymerase sigma-70 factor (ECF subfamily)
MQEAMSHSHAEPRPAYEVGRLRWPDVPLTYERFAAHLAILVIDEARLMIHAADLFLAIAAVRGDARALQHFDREYLRPAKAAVARIDRAPHFVDDVMQHLRLVLLTGAEPKLGTYAAAGRLLDWVRVSAVRTALNLKRAEYRILPTEDVRFDALLPAVEGELDGVRGRYVQEVQLALADCFKRLAPRERNLLRLHFIDGLSLDALATMHGVHRATVARWLVSIRRALLDEACSRLGGEQRLASRSVRSLYRWLEQDLHLSISKLLAVEASAPASRGSDPGALSSG